jgi:hypothetical protein
MQNTFLLGLLAASFSGVMAIAQETQPEQPERKPAVVPAPVAPRPGLQGLPTPPPPSGGNSWFAVTHQDLGTYFGQGEAVGVFKFKNPTDKTVDWRNLHGSCQCAKATVRVGGRTYELVQKPSPSLSRITKVPGQPDQIERVQQIAIDAGQEGEVEVHLDMNGITGPKQASVDVHTTDPALPQFKLNFVATGAQLFAISPSEVNLNKMTWSETREFTVTVTSPQQKDWNITRMDDAGKVFSATWEKVLNGDNTSWVIKGKYGPVDGDTAGGGVLKFHTDVQGGATFNVRVLAFVQGPLEVKPGAFLTLGLIRKGSGLTREIVFEPNDGTQLAAAAVKFEKLTMSEEFVTVNTRQDGNKLVVQLVVSDKAPAGLLRGDLVVGLNHPLVKEKKIMFNGFVR